MKQIDKPILEHSDTGKLLSKLVVPHWSELLMLAAKSFEMTGLGYLGADVVIDKELGPMVLELNARPGLAIQAANGMGLLSCFQEIESMGKEADRMQPGEHIAFSQRYFSGQLP